MSDEIERGIKICIDAPLDGGSGVFRIHAADRILALLADAHETEFSIPELVETTGAARSTVWRAVELLDDIGAIRIRETPQRKYVAIDPERLQKDDPILGIEQSAFREPVRAFIDRTQAAIDEADDIERTVGIVVFGSVARGEADRQSDIDLLVVIDGDRTSARRHVTDLVGDLREQRFDGERFEFEPYVESVESARRARAKLRDIFEEGITVYSSPELQSLRKSVMTDE